MKNKNSRLIQMVARKRRILRESEMVYIQDCKQGDIGRMWVIGWYLFYLNKNRWIRI